MAHLKNKKGMFFIPILVALSLIIIGIVLVILFNGRIASVTTPIFEFLSKWWWSVALFLFCLTKVGQGVMRWILGHLGIKV